MRRTRVSTSWMLTGWRWKLRVSPNASMRSIRPRMRSVSSQISCVISRSAGGKLFFQQLRRAADPCQRIFDLMRQNRRHAVHGAHRAPRHQLAVHALRQAAFGESDHQGAVRFAQRRHGDIGQALAMPGGGKIDIALGRRGVALARLRHQLKQGRIEQQQVGQILLQQDGRAGVEKLLGGRIGVDNLPLRPDHQDRGRQAYWRWGIRSATGGYRGVCTKCLFFRHILSMTIL